VRNTPFGTFPLTDMTLEQLGWTEHFADQVEDTDTPVRVSVVHRSSIEAIGPNGSVSLTTPEMTGKYAVGDWVLHDKGQVTRHLDRTTLLQRRAAGVVAYRQLIAANVDTLGIVTSCNADFNLPRLERYLALCAASGSAPLIVLTKVDQCEDVSTFIEDARSLLPDLPIVAMNATNADEANALAPYCSDGKTLALVGSSGVGKTTIQNTLTGIEDATQGNRHGDFKGKHTTTSRALRPTLAGGWLIDTPGMRELRLTDSADGIDTVFPDVAELVAECRFTDCAHDSEPGCAVRAAIDSGDLDPDRFERWQKLQAEDNFNSETLASGSKKRRRQPMPGQRNTYTRKKRR